MSDKDCVLFQPTGAPCKINDYRQDGPDHGKVLALSANDPGVVDGWPGFRAVPFSLPAAVERVALLLGWRDDRPDPAMSGGVNVPPPEMQRAIRAAILGASEPEPEPWEIEAATTWFRIPAEKRDAAALAAHFARARASGKGKGSALLGEGKGEGA